MFVCKLQINQLTWCWNICEFSLSSARIMYLYTQKKTASIFKVCVLNIWQCCSQGPLRELHTLAAPPSRQPPPRPVTLTSRSVQLEWDEPLAPNGVIERLIENLKENTRKNYLHLEFYSWVRQSEWTEIRTINSLPLINSISFCFQLWASSQITLPAAPPACTPPMCSRARKNLLLWQKAELQCDRSLHVYVKPWYFKIYNKTLDVLTQFKIHIEILFAWVPN